jgi:hypothetical protein
LGLARPLRPGEAEPLAHQLQQGLFDADVAPPAGEPPCIELGEQGGDRLGMAVVAVPAPLRELAVEPSSRPR